MKSYKVVGNVTGLELDSIVTEDELGTDAESIKKAKHAHLGGVERLIGLKAIEEAPAADAKADKKADKK